MKQSSSNTLSSQSGSITYRLQIRSAPTGPGLLCPALIDRLMIVSSCSRVLLDLPKFPFRCRGCHCLSKIWKPGQVGGICTQSGKSRQESKMSQLAWLSRARKPVGQVRRNYYVYMNYWLVRCSIAYTWMVLPLLWKPNSSINQSINQNTFL